MKLRIKGNSIRLRVSQSELVRLLADGHLEDTIAFAPAPDAHLTYALAIREAHSDIAIEYRAQTVTIVLSTGAAQRWANTDDVGIYGDGRISLVVEKDFACLDTNDPQDADAFPNPHTGVAC